MKEFTVTIGPRGHRKMDRKSFKINVTGDVPQAVLKAARAFAESGKMEYRSFPNGVEYYKYVLPSGGRTYGAAEVSRDWINGTVSTSVRYQGQWYHVRFTEQWEGHRGDQVGLDVDIKAV